jgi:hypothetical protein
VTIPMRAAFNRRWSVLWCTTYTCDVIAFEEYFLNQLGDPPLNMTILADFQAHARGLAAIDDQGNRGRMRRLGKDYLLRGVAWPTGAFHPKTYLFGNQDAGLLLVGSGNAGLDGLLRGHELFSSFDAGTPEELVGIRSWAHWMEWLIERLDDRLVSGRWRDLRARLPWLSPEETDGPFATNRRRPLARQLAGLTPTPVDELHLMAPFFDPEALTVRELLATIRPACVHMYLHHETSVDGRHLRSVLDRAGTPAHLWQLAPAQFVHAKLVGLICGERGILLGGSANLSQVALLRTPESGNVEAGVISMGTASSVRSLFCPTGMSLEPLAVDELAAYRLRDEAAAPTHPVRLLRAELQPDGRLSLAWTPMTAGPVLARATTGGDPIRLAEIQRDPTARFIDAHLGLTAGPWTESSALVELVGEHGETLSNRIAIDDPARLELFLRDRSQQERPKLGIGLDESDLDPMLAEVLDDLRVSCYFDVASAQRRSTERALDTAMAGDASFWDQTGKLDLTRAGGRHSHLGQSRLDANPVFAQLQAMLLQAPYLPPLRLLAAGTETMDDDDDPDRPARAWKLQTRIRVRVMNVLRRWCESVSDPDLREFDPNTPAENYLQLVGALQRLWLGDGQRRFLSLDDLKSLLTILLGAVVGRTPRMGLMPALDEAHRLRVRERIKAAAADRVAALLLFDALRPGAGSVSRQVFAWQDMLVQAMEHGVVGTDDPAVQARIEWAANYLDDPHWCERTGARLGLDLRLSQDGLAAGFDYLIDVRGLNGLLDDQRAVELLVSFLAHKSVPGVILGVRGTEDRIALNDGESAFARVRGQSSESIGALWVSELQSLHGAGRSLQAAFPLASTDHQAASS